MPEQGVMPANLEANHSLKPRRLPPLVRKQLQKEALRLFLEGVPQTTISERLKVSRVTLRRWNVNFNWDLIKEKLEQKELQEVSNVVQAMKDRHIQITRAIQANLVEQINEETEQGKKKLKVSVQDALKAMEHEAKLTIPEFTPTTQVNTTIQNAQSFVALLEEAKKEREHETPDI